MGEFTEHRIRTPRTARVLAFGSPRSASEAWFLLHGYAQRADEMLESCRALANGRRLLIAPQGLSSFYRRGAGGPTGATWMTRDGREHEIADYVEYLDGVAAFVEHDLGFAGARAVLGFSQGAATAWRWAALGRTTLARMIASGGAIPPDLDLSAARPRLAGLSLEIVRGLRDTSYSQEALSSDSERLAAAGLAASAREIDAGHELPPSWLAQL